MYYGTTTTDLQVHEFRLNERQEKAARYHELTRDDVPPVRNSSLLKRLASRIRIAPAPRVLAPQH